MYYRDGLPVEVERMPAGGLTERIIRSGEPLRLTGKLQVSLDDPKTGGQAAKRMARSYFGLPLKAGERTIGVITVINYERYDAFTSTHERILNTLAAQVAVAIENARLFGEVRAAAEELEQRIAERTRDVQQERDRVELLLRMTSELSASLDLDSVLTRSLTLVKDSIGATQGSLFLNDPHSDGLIHRASLCGAPLTPGRQPAPFGRRAGLTGLVLRARAATLS